MKKLVISSALMATTAIAAAQSSVTLFGIVDATLMRGSGSVASRTQLGGGGLSTSRIGFRGVEDLGGGMSAGFWLEAGINPDTGAGGATNTNNQTTGAAPAGLSGAQGLTFARRSTVSLMGGWGELRLGRDFSAQFYNRFTYEPWGNNGVGASQAFVGMPGNIINRVSNTVIYFLPSNTSGVYGSAQYYLGENPSNAGATKDDGSGAGVRVGWKSGPFDIAVAHARTEYATTATAGDITSSNIGARYDFGAFSLMGGYFRDRVAMANPLTGTGYQVAGIWRVGVGEVRAMLSEYKAATAGQPESKKLSLGYVHNLSKRTAVYGTYAHVRNSRGATTALNGAVTAPNQSSSGLDLGIRHTF